MFPDSGWVKASGKQLWRVGGLGPERSKPVGLAQKGECTGKDSPSFVGGEQAVSPQDGSSPGFDSEPQASGAITSGTTYLYSLLWSPRAEVAGMHLVPTAASIRQVIGT